MIIYTYICVNPNGPSNGIFARVTCFGVKGRKKYQKNYPKPWQKNAIVSKMERLKKNEKKREMNWLINIYNWLIKRRILTARNRAGTEIRSDATRDVSVCINMNFIIYVTHLSCKRSLPASLVDGFLRFIVGKYRWRRKKIIYAS